MTRWLYSLFVAIDANFRLKRKAVSSDVIDPGLSRGWAYFVEETAYKSYLSKLINEPQPVCRTGGAPCCILILHCRKVIVPATVQ